MNSPQSGKDGIAKSGSDVIVENEETIEVPPEVLLRGLLEEGLSALRENRQIPKPVLELESFLGRMLSDLLDRFDARLANEDFDKCVQKAHLTLEERGVLELGFESPPLTAKQIGEHLGKQESIVRAAFFRAQRKLEKIQSPLDEAIGGVIAYDVNAVNVVAQTLLKVRRLYEEDSTQLKVPTDFKGKVNEAYETETMFRSQRTDFNTTFSQIMEEPIAGLFKQLNFLIWENRLHRRYLRTRFGMKQKLIRRLVFKRTRHAKSQRMFYNWWNKNAKAESNQSPEFETDRQRYRDEILREEALRRYAQDRLISMQTRQTIWQNAIFLSFTSLYKKHGGVKFELAEFASDILTRMEQPLKDFRLLLDESKLKTEKRVFPRL